MSSHSASEDLNSVPLDIIRALTLFVSASSSSFLSIPLPPLHHPPISFCFRANDRSHSKESLVSVAFSLRAVRGAGQRFPTPCSMSHDGQYERSTLMILGESNAKDWFYKGEGAANLVLGYCGSSPFLVGKVLRIQKIPNKKTLSANKGLALSSHERLIWKDVGEILESTSRDFAARAFIQHVMTDLLNSKHIDAGILIYVSKEFLDDIERNIKSQRPAWRVDAANINKLCEFALLISDHSVITSES